MTIERIKQLLEIAHSVNYHNTYYDIVTYDKVKSAVMLHATGDGFTVSVDELAKDTDIIFYRWEKIE